MLSDISPRGFIKPPRDMLDVGSSSCRCSGYLGQQLTNSEPSSACERAGAKRGVD